MSAKLQQMFDLYQQCTKEDQRKFRNLIFGPARAGDTPKGSSTYKRDEKSLEHLLYTFLENQFRKVLGVRLPKLSYLRDTAALNYLTDAVAWLTRGKPMEVRTRQALLLMAAESVVLDARLHNRVPNTKTDVVNMLAQLPRLVENQYPGYRNNGLLERTAAAVARGHLTKSDEDPLKED